MFISVARSDCLFVLCDISLLLGMAGGYILGFLIMCSTDLLQQ